MLLIFLVFSVAFFLFCFVCLRSVSGVQCCLCFWIVHSWLFRRFSLTFIYLDIEIRSTRVILTLRICYRLCDLFVYPDHLFLVVCISGLSIGSLFVYSNHQFVSCWVYIRIINCILFCISGSHICSLLWVYPDRHVVPCFNIRIVNVFFTVCISGSSICSFLFVYQDRHFLFLVVCISESSIFFLLVNPDRRCVLS